MKVWTQIQTQGRTRRVRSHALCDCGWQTTSTGPKAEGRVCKYAAEHHCYPSGMPGEGQVSRP